MVRAIFILANVCTSIVVLVGSPHALAIEHEVALNFGAVERGTTADARIQNFVLNPDGERIGKYAYSFSNAGDVNGDGIDDVIIGYGGRRSNGGQVALLFGKPGDLQDRMSIDDIDGTNGVVIPEPRHDEFRYLVVKGVGDLNGDGFDDIGTGTRPADTWILQPQL